MDLRPLGVTQGSVAEAARWMPPLDQACGKTLSCFVVVNATPDWEIVGFAYDTANLAAGEQGKWADQFPKNYALDPMKAMLMPRIGADKRMRTIPLRVTFRNVKTDAVFEDMLGTVDLQDDRRHSLVRLVVRVAFPTVTVEPPPEAPVPTPH